MQYIKVFRHLYICKMDGFSRQMLQKFAFFLFFDYNREIRDKRYEICVLYLYPSNLVSYVFIFLYHFL